MEFVYTVNAVKIRIAIKKKSTCIPMINLSFSYMKIWKRSTMATYRKLPEITARKKWLYSSKWKEYPR